MSHTLGPWKVRCLMKTEPNGWYKAAIHDGESFDDGEHIASVFGEADAALIAAAPEMLEALEELVDIEGPLPGTATWHAKVMAVIAKARGGDHA